MTPFSSAPAKKPNGNFRRARRSSTKTASRSSAKRKPRPISRGPRSFNGEILETADSYYVRRPDQDNRIVFTMKKHVCAKEIPAGELQNLLENGRTNLIEGFMSKRMTPFSAYLVLSKNRAKAEFEFPPR